MCVYMFRPLSGHPLILLLQNQLWEASLRSPSFVLKIVISENCVNPLKDYEYPELYQTFSSYRTVTTFRLGYENKSVYGSNLCL